MNSSPSVSQSTTANRRDPFGIEVDQSVISVRPLMNHSPASALLISLSAHGLLICPDYCTFDSNDWICIEHCLCGTRGCRRFVRADDYRIVELQHKYRGHFLPYIQQKIDEEAQAAKSGRVIGGAGGPCNDFSAASVRAYHESHPVDIEAHNRRATAALIARFATNAPVNGLRALSCKENVDNCSVADPKVVRAPETIAV